jgi:hypothetical protein
MMRLRNAVMAAMLGTSVTGCALSQHGIARYSIWHCDDCDDFPTPGYGPGYSMMPGTYTGPPARDSLEPAQPAAATPAPGSVAPVAPPVTSPTTPNTVTPPPPPAAAPDQGASAHQPAGNPLDRPGSEITGTDPVLPPLPPGPAAPVIQPGS